MRQKRFISDKNKEKKYNTSLLKEFLFEIKLKED
jgi:hypothetical protein